MKKHFIAIILIIIALAILLPFASRAPDGLQKLAATSGMQKQKPAWNGLMSNYSIETIGNQYVSTFLAGLFGTVVVLVTTFVLGIALAPRKKDSIK